MHVYQPTNKGSSDQQISFVTATAVSIIRFQKWAKMYSLSNIETHKARRENFRFKPQSLLGPSDVAFGCVTNSTKYTNVILSNIYGSHVHDFTQKAVEFTQVRH